MREELINFLKNVDEDDLYELGYGMISEEELVDRYLKDSNICQ